MNDAGLRHQKICSRISDALRAQGELTTPLLEGFALPIDELFAD